MSEILTQQGDVILVDERDYPALSKYRWCIDKSSGYVVRSEVIDGRSKKIYMHREIMGLKRGDLRQVDHEFLPRTDNRRANLRVCSQGENLLNKRVRTDNKLGLKGVHLHKSTGKYRAAIWRSGRRTDLGLFQTAELAHLAYCAAADKLHGKFANHGDK